MPKRNIFTIIILIAIVVCGVFFFIMWNDTRNLVTYVSDVFYGNIPAEELEGKTESAYNVKNYKYENHNAEVDLSLKTRFVWHNFRKGYIWINYTVTAKTPGGILVYGTKDADAKWDIEKVDGKWAITKIWEEL